MEEIKAEKPGRTRDENPLASKPLGLPANTLSTRRQSSSSQDRACSYIVMEERIYLTVTFLTIRLSEKQ